MKVIFSTGTRFPERLTPLRECERAGVSPYIFGGLLLAALVALPVLLRVLAFVPTP